MNQLYMKDAYLKENKTIIAQQRVVKKKPAVILEDNIFYPGGGGQPYDIGSLEISGKKFNVTRVVKIDGSSWLCLDDKAEIADGTEVLANIDWERRYKFMRCHTAAHVVMGAIKRNVEDYSPRGIEINEECEIELSFSGQWDASQETAEKIINLANDTIANGGTIYAEDFNDISDAVSKYSEIFRGSTEFIGDVRIVIIENWDANPCGGTHVKNLDEVGKVELICFSSGNFKIRIKTEVR